MEFPIRVASATAVPVLPRGPGWWYEPKFDGHRMVLRRTEESVVLYARSGRIVTSHWMDLATAGMHSLLPVTVLDGEAVIKVAVQWQQASGGDWAAYAADVAQRNPDNHDSKAQP
ncbi:hypothetical protein ACF08M_40965 [Streptomyces sp. NPDC015032]|uniref:ATP-dependent DNA ligase n=1 Tax=Streptomyces sp. NPDC015032 TaxID=3364937 RepID=UPI0036F9CFB7